MDIEIIHNMACTLVDITRDLNHKEFTGNREEAVKDVRQLIADLHLQIN